MKRFLTILTAGLMTLAPLAASAQERMFEVLFDFDSAQLDAEAQTTLDRAAEMYQSTGAATVAIEGHTDTVASQDYNLELSQRRARSVTEALVSRGVPQSVMRVRGVGERDLAVQTGEGVRLRENRRVTVNLSGPAPQPEPEPGPEPAPAPVADAGFGITVAPYGAWNNQPGNDSFFAGLNFSTSYELTSNLVGSFEQAVFYEFTGREDGIGGRTAAGLDLQVDAAGVLPYVGANVGAIYTDGSYGFDYFAGPEVGVKFGFLSAKLAYDVPFDRGFDHAVLSATVGGGYQF